MHLVVVALAAELGPSLRPCRRVRPETAQLCAEPVHVEALALGTEATSGSRRRTSAPSPRETVSPRGRKLPGVQSGGVGRSCSWSKNVVTRGGKSKNKGVRKAGIAGVEWTVKQSGWTVKQSGVWRGQKDKLRVRKNRRGYARGFKKCGAHCQMTEQIIQDSLNMRGQCIHMFPCALPASSSA